MVDSVKAMFSNWEVDRLTSGYDPLPMMNRACEILEEEIAENFYELTSLNNMWNVIQEFIFYKHILDEYVQRSTYSEDMTLEYKTASVRFLLCMSHVAELSVDDDTSSAIVKALIKWTINSPEPLQSYATGLLSNFIYYQQEESDRADKDVLTMTLLKRLVDNHIPSRYERDVFWQLSPLNEVTKQYFIFKVLKAMLLYDNHIAKLLNCDGFNVLMECLDGAGEPRVVGLMIVSRNYLQTLLLEKDFTFRFIAAGGVQILIGNIRDELHVGLLGCLKNLASCDGAMNKLCLEHPEVAHDMVLSMLAMLDNPSYHRGLDILKLFGWMFHYKLILELFDANGGLQKVRRLLVFVRNFGRWSKLNAAFNSINYYAQSHLVLKHNELYDVQESVNNLWANFEDVRDLVDKVLIFCPFSWEVMESMWELVVSDGIRKIMECRYFLHLDLSKMRRVFDALSIYSLIPAAQKMLCQQFVINGEQTSALQDILQAIKYEDCFCDIITQSVLRIIINCVSVHIIENGDNSILENSWKTLRECNGLIRLMGLLNPKKMFTDEVRLLTCKALCGMARNDEFKRIIRMQPFYRNGHLQEIIYFNVKRADPNIYASNLLELVGPVEDALLPIDVPSNFLTRLSQRQTGTNRIGNVSDKKLLYSRLKPIPSDVSKGCNWMQADNCMFRFTCIKFVLDTNEIVICDNTGAILHFDVYKGLLSARYNMTKPCLSVDFRRSGDLMLTSYRSDSTLRRSLNFDSCIHEFDYERYTQFCNWDQTKILASRKQHASLIDSDTGTYITKFNPIYKNDYELYQATQSLDDRQILFDGVLFDGNTGEFIHKFEKFNSIQNGVFHPNGYELIINDEVWDLRTRSLVKVVPIVDEYRVSFSTHYNVLFAEPLHTNFTTCMHILDSHSYDTINTIEADGYMNKFDVNNNNTKIAIGDIVQPDFEFFVKLYSVGGITPPNK